MNWSSRYVGIPYSVRDCYALVREVLERECGILIPPPENEVSTYTTIAEAQPIVDCYWNPVLYEDRAEFDVVFFKGTEMTHCGILISRTRFLHTSEATGAIVERLGDRYWQDRLEGCYRAKE